MTEQPAHSDTTEPDADIADLGYEEARQELVELVARLEGGQAGLEESMRLWQRGEALAAHCEAWLDKAEASLSQQAPTTGTSEDSSGPTPAD